MYLAGLMSGEFPVYIEPKFPDGTAEEAPMFSLLWRAVIRESESGEA